jgi:rhodanese-related sulfurtransferase
VKFFADNVFLIGIALVSGGMLVWPMINRRSGSNSVDASQATQLMNREHALLIDVRAADDYAKGHVAQAKSLPLASVESNPESVGKKDKPVILMCNTGVQSGKAVALLRKAGFEKVFNLQGGLAAWQAAGLPVVKG